MKKINVLGTEWTIRCGTPQEYPMLDDCDGYTDKTTREIIVASEMPDNELGDFEAYSRKVLRHEIIHAFLFESGLHENWEHQCGHDETYVDWIAAQFPKLLEAFKEADAL